MDFRMKVETPFDNAETHIHQLDSISRPYPVTPRGIRLRLQDG